MQDIVEEIYAELVKQFGVGEVLFPTTIDDKNRIIYWKEFIKLVCIDNLAGESIAIALNLRSSQNLSKYIAKYTPKIKEVRPPKLPWKSYLLLLLDSKKCPTCNVIYSIEFFRKNSSRFKGITSECIYCEQKYKDSTKEQTAIYHKKYRLLNIEKVTKYASEYRLLHKNEISVWHKNYYQNNKPYYRAKDAKYRAAKLKATPNWANLIAIKEIYATCPTGYHVDHIVPLNNDLVCGLHCEFNLQHLSAHDNLSKGNKYEP